MNAAGTGLLNHRKRFLFGAFWGGLLISVLGYSRAKFPENRHTCAIRTKILFRMPKELLNDGRLLGLPAPNPCRVSRANPSSKFACGVSLLLRSSNGSRLRSVNQKDLVKVPGIRRIWRPRVSALKSRQRPSSPSARVGAWPRPRSVRAFYPAHKVNELRPMAKFSPSFWGRPRISLAEKCLDFIQNNEMPLCSFPVISIYRFINMQIDMPSEYYSFDQICNQSIQLMVRQVISFKLCAQWL